MHGLLNLSHLLGVLLAVVGAWSIRFELKRKSVRVWRLFLPAAAVLLCSLALLGGLSTRGRGIWLVALLAGLPAGAVRGLWLRMRTDYAARLVRLSPVRDGLWTAVVAALLAVTDVFVTLRSEEDAPVSPLFAAGAALCAGYLGGRALVTRTRSRSAMHLDLR